MNRSFDAFEDFATIALTSGAWAGIALAEENPFDDILAEHTEQLDLFDDQAVA